MEPASSFIETSSFTVTPMSAEISSHEFGRNRIALKTVCTGLPEIARSRLSKTNGNWIAYEAPDRVRRIRNLYLCDFLEGKGMRFDVPYKMRPLFCLAKQLISLRVQGQWRVWDEGRSQWEKKGDAEPAIEWSQVFSTRSEIFEVRGTENEVALYNMCNPVEEMQVWSLRHRFNLKTPEDRGPELDHDALSPYELKEELEEGKWDHFNDFGVSWDGTNVRLIGRGTRGAWLEHRVDLSGTSVVELHHTAEKVEVVSGRTLVWEKGSLTWFEGLEKVQVNAFGLPSDKVISRCLIPLPDEKFALIQSIGPCTFKVFRISKDQDPRLILAGEWNQWEVLHGLLVYIPNGVEQVMIRDLSDDEHSSEPLPVPGRPVHLLSHGDQLWTATREGALFELSVTPDES